ncbi:MAG: hypothetical protein F6J87_04865 [Spirulina sp. SIO3F2]|nr:hypothetical protein [Spirulina sp. SIO3F2]
MLNQFNQQSPAQKLFCLFLGGILLLILMVMGASLFAGGSPDLIVSDANGYYSWTRSIFLDGDVDFRNDYAYLYAPDPLPSDMARSTPRGLVPNKYPIGMGILYIPGFILGHLTALVTPFMADGASLPYQFFVPFSLALLVLGGFYLFFTALMRSGIKTEVALPVSCLMLLGTNLLHYVAKEPAMSHAAGVTVLNALIFLSTCHSFFSQRPILARSLAGGLSGLLVVIRLSNIVFVPFIWVLFHDELRKFKDWLPLLFGGSLFMLIQELMYFWLWGIIVIYPYKGEGFNAGFTGLYESLLGQNWGVFLHHPWYLILVICNLVGVIIIARHRLLFSTALLSFVGLWILNGLWNNFATSFGHRAFIELLPALSLPAAVLLNSIMLTKSVKRLGIVIAALLVFLNVHIWAGYLLQKYDHNPHRTLADVYLWTVR